MVPRRILLATDLRSRSDRALDRAAQLARQWNAPLVVIHAMEPKPVGLRESAEPLPSWRKPPNPAPNIERQIRRDLREEVNHLTIQVEEGDPSQVILDTVEREGCDLIVLGAAQDELFGGRIFGSTVEYLMKKSPVSVLVVKARPNGPYSHILVGTDFTDESRYGLEVAAGSFPHSQMMVMHAFDLPYRSLLSDTALGKDFAAMERATIQEFVAGAELPDAVRSRIRTSIEHGPPDLMLRRYIEEKHADLTVIGAYGRGRLYHLLVSGNTPRIVESVPSDILLVRAHRDRGSTEAQ
jgi:nucleotide-binding universal stress UspA family protein